ncbi:hypothetical protein [Actinoplanes sp. TBRC 11911]|nr:hypothetical protein [Actinoplanes sp. TBRC 11911]
MSNDEFIILRADPSDPRTSDPRVLGEPGTSALGAERAWTWTW